MTEQKKNFIAVEVDEFSHHGEILQGAFEDENGVIHRGLITLKCNLFKTKAVFVKIKGKNGVHVIPEEKTKAQNAAQKTLSYLGMSEQYGGYLIICSDIPEELGFGSSTSDVIASINSVARAFESKIREEEMAKIAVEAECASDAIMFKNCILFAQREGKILKKYLHNLPEFFVIGCKDGNSVNTLEMKIPEYTEDELKTFRILAALFEKGVRDKDVKLIGTVATTSAEINQSYLPKPHFEQFKMIANETGAVGIQIAHSGTIVGLLYDIKCDQEVVFKKVKQNLNALGINDIWRFETKEEE